MIEGDEWKMGKPAAKKPISHIASITLVGEIIEPGRVLTAMPTEWPKVGCIVRVTHNADQHTMFAVVAIGPLAETMLKLKRGATVKVVGAVKAATGALEVFATEFGKFKDAKPQSMYLSLGSIFGNEPPKPADDDEDDD